MSNAREWVGGQVWSDSKLGPIALLIAREMIDPRIESSGRRIVIFKRVPEATQRCEMR